jgi:glycosyltransferase involved in cell wall biosynthesis
MYAMKNICICTTVHSAWDSRIFEREIKTLLTKYHVLYVAPESGSIAERLSPNLTLIQLPKSRHRIVRVLRNISVFRMLYSLRGQVISYHVHDPELSTVLTLLKIITGKTCIYDMHENHAAAIRDRFWIWKPLRKVIACIFSIIERFCVPFFDEIICASAEIGQIYPHKRSTIIENYPSKIHYISIPEYEQKKPQILLAGGLTEVRGIIQTVEAFIIADLPSDFQLLLLGWFESDELKSFILEKLSNSEKFRNFQYFPWVPYQKSIKYMKESSIGIVPYLDYKNHRYGIPNKIYEFMATCTPVIYNTLSYYLKAIGQYPIGLAVDCSNPIKIAKAMEKLAHDSTLRRKMGIEGRKLFLTRFNWEYKQATLLELYDNIMNKDAIQ